MVRSLARRVGSRADAEDLVRSALLRALERAADLRQQDRVVPWFARILGTSLADHRRRRAAESRMRSRLASDIEGQGPATDLRWLTCRCLEAALSTIRPEHRDLVRRVELGGTPLRQVARELGVRPNTLAVRLHRARRALVRALRQICRFCRLHWGFDYSCAAAPGQLAIGAFRDGGAVGP
jgi:RNA polymerase sigma-70 factor (ECF subfamily)